MCFSTILASLSIINVVNSRASHVSALIGDRAGASSLPRGGLFSRFTLHDVEGTQAPFQRSAVEPGQTTENNIWTTLVGDSKKSYPQPPPIHGPLFNAPDRRELIRPPRGLISQPWRHKQP